MQREKLRLLMVDQVVAACERELDRWLFLLLLSFWVRDNSSDPPPQLECAPSGVPLWACLWVRRGSRACAVLRVNYARRSHTKWPLWGCLRVWGRSLARGAHFQLLAVPGCSWLLLAAPLAALLAFPWLLSWLAASGYSRAF
jgi:hypothetical protein